MMEYSKRAYDICGDLGYWNCCGVTWGQKLVLQRQTGMVQDPGADPWTGGGQNKDQPSLEGPLMLWFTYLVSRYLVYPQWPLWCDHNTTASWIGLPNLCRPHGHTWPCHDPRKCQPPTIPMKWLAFGWQIYTKNANQCRPMQAIKETTAATYCYLVSHNHKKSNMAII